MGRGHYEKGLGDYAIPLFDVTQSLIIRARKNKDKIDLFLRHHRKHNGKSDAILQDIWKENTIGGSFPGHYYRSVKVCSNCFHVYEFIKDRNRMVHEKKRTKKNVVEQGNTEDNRYDLTAGLKEFSKKIHSA